MSHAVYQVITDRVIKLLEDGVCPWRRPWQAVEAQNFVSRKAYRGVNSLVLNSVPFESPFWLTFRQAGELGGSVRKGEHGVPVVFWKWLEKEDTESEKPRRFPLLRYYTVFNASQCDGLSVPEAAPTREPVPPHPVVARYVASGGPDFRIGSGGAFYRPADDSVHVPAPGAFESPDAYHSTVFHELVHSTGHKKRLGRFESPEQFEFASASYSREELVAELGAAFLCGECGISRTLENSASYLDAWLRVLRQPKNSRLIVEAAGKAQKAADFVLARDAYTEGGES